MTLPVRSRDFTSAMAGALFVLALAVGSASAQITTNTALPVTEGRGVLRVQSKVVRSSDGGPMKRELTTYGFPIIGVYGVTPDWTVFGVLPILDKNLDVMTPQGRMRRGLTGLGDARLFARYTVWTRNRAGQTQRLAPLAGVEIPTGDHDATDRFGRLPPPLQLGSGAWDPFAGLVFTWQTLKWQVDVSPVYQLNVAAGNFEFGDEARLDVASKYRLWLNERAAGVSGFLYGNLETNLIWRGQNRKNAHVVEKSGGATWFAAPGMQYVTRRFVVEGAVQIPVLETRAPTALEKQFITTFSLRVNI